MYKLLFFPLLISLTFCLCSCATEKLRENTVSAGVTTTDIRYEMVLSNIAMLHYYKVDGVVPAVIPSDFQVTVGTIAVNDSEGITPGLIAGGAHGIVVPSVTMPLSRALQQQWSAVPTLDPKLLLALEKAYLDEQPNPIYQDAGLLPAPPGVLSGTYRDYTVWVKKKDMSALTAFVEKIAGIPERNPPAKPQHIVIDKAEKLKMENASTLQTLREKQFDSLMEQSGNQGPQPVVNINQTTH